MIADIILTLESLLVIPPTHLADILPAKSKKIGSPVVQQVQQRLVGLL